MWQALRGAASRPPEPVCRERKPHTFNFQGHLMVFDNHIYSDELLFIWCVNCAGANYSTYGLKNNVHASEHLCTEIHVCMYIAVL